MNDADRAVLALAADVLDHLPTVLAGECARLGLSQEAAAGEIGVDRQTVNRWIKGRTRPDVADVVLIFRWLAKVGTQ